MFDKELSEVKKISNEIWKRGSSNSWNDDEDFFSISRKELCTLFAFIDKYAVEHIRRAEDNPVPDLYKHFKKVQ